MQLTEDFNVIDAAADVVESRLGLLERSTTRTSTAWMRAAASCVAAPPAVATTPRWQAGCGPFAAPSRWTTRLR